MGVHVASERDRRIANSAVESFRSQLVELFAGLGTPLLVELIADHPMGPPNLGDLAAVDRLREARDYTTARANELPGLTATLDEFRCFADLVRECLADPDSPDIARIRDALEGLSR